MGRLDLAITFFFFNDTATTEIYTLSLHDALPIWRAAPVASPTSSRPLRNRVRHGPRPRSPRTGSWSCARVVVDRKSTRLNSSHSQISYAVFCLKKKKYNQHSSTPLTEQSR